MDGLIADLKSSFRNSRRRPLTTLAAVLILGFGIAANTAVYSAVKVLLEPLPIPESERLVRLRIQMMTGGMDIQFPPSLKTAQAWAEESQKLSRVVPYGQGTVRWIEDANVTKLDAVYVASDMFELLGVEPVQGRRFAEEEYQNGNERVALLSHALWQERFGARNDILGETFLLGSQQYEVVGILPRQAPFVERLLTPDLWLPLAEDAGIPTQTVAQLVPGVTRQEAQDESPVISERLLAAGLTNEGMTPLVAPLDNTTERMRPALRILQVAVALVLLVVCSNVAHLLLAQGESRGHELATRTVLGADRQRLVRQLITESLVLSVFGGVLALILMLWAKDLLAVALPPELRAAELILERFTIDAGALTFNALICVLAALAFGLLPAWQLSSPRLTERLQPSGQIGGQRSRQWTRATLVACEVALTFLLLVGAGLVIHRLVTAQKAGFDVDRMIAFRLALDEDHYQDDVARLALGEELLERFKGHPKIERVALASDLPPDYGLGIGTFSLGRSAGEMIEIPQGSFQLTQVSEDYFRTLGIPLRGNAPQAISDDESGVADSVVINEALASKIGTPEDAIGGIIDWGGRERRIVGVAADAKHISIDTSLPHIYLPFRANEDMLTFAVRSRIANDPDAAALINDLRAQVRELSPAVTVDLAATGEDLMAADRAPERFQAQLLTFFAGLAALLALLGIYAMVAHLVSRSAKEIGVRVALGARQNEVVRQITGRGMKPVAAGWVIGLVGSVALSRALQSVIAGLEPKEPTVYVVVALLVATVALFAVYWPARRAARVDPMTVLRQD